MSLFPFKVLPRQSRLFALVALVSTWPALAAGFDEADRFDEFGSGLVSHGNRVLVTPFQHRRSDGNVFLFRLDEAGWQAEALFAQRSQMSSGNGLRTAAMDADTVALGFPFISDPSMRLFGEVDVYRRDGTGWSLDATLRAPAPAKGQRFGTALVVQGDWLAVGAPGDPSEANTSDPGRVLVFQRQVDGYAWVQTLTPADGQARDRYGMQLYFAGGQLLVNAPEHRSSPGADRGAVYAYALDGGSWAPRQKLPTGSWRQVAAHGELLVTGHPSFVAVYGLQDGEWAPREQLPIVAGSQPLSDLAVLDGDPQRIAVVTGPVNFTEDYASYFERIDGSWSQRWLGASSPYAISAALTADRLLLGDPSFEAGRLSSRGVVLSYRLQPEGPEAELPLAPGGDRLGDRFGHALAVDGDWMLASAEGRDLASGSGIARDAGLALILRHGPDGWQPHQELAPSAPGALQTFGRLLDLRGDLALVASQSSATTISPGAIEVYRRQGENWSPSCQLTLPGPGPLPFGPYTSLGTDGEHVLASVWDQIHAWRVTASGCEYGGRVLLSDLGFERPVLSSNVVEGRVLVRRPQAFVDGAWQPRDWSVLDFDGQAWVESSRITDPCDGASAVLRSRQRAAFLCGGPTPSSGPSRLAWVLDEGVDGWQTSHALTLADRDRAVTRLAWEGDNLAVGLGGLAPFREVRVFRAPDFVEAETLALDAEGCAGSFDTVLVAQPGRIVVGCPDHHLPTARRSGKLLAYSRVTVGPDAGEFDAGTTLLLQANTLLHRDGFEDTSP